MGSLGQVHVDCLAVALVNVDTVKDGKGRMWQERVSPRGEGEKMKALLTAKVGMFLVVSSVLALWTLLAAQHVQAHKGSRVNVSPLPVVVAFLGIHFLDASETRPITSSERLAPTGLVTKKGGGTSGRGDVRYHYAKITIPALAAGELRVFDAEHSLGRVFSVGAAVGLRDP